MGGHGEASPKGGDAVSILELFLKLLDGGLKLVGILTGLKTLVEAGSKRGETRKTTGNRLAP